MFKNNTKYVYQKYEHVFIKYIELKGKYAHIWLNIKNMGLCLSSIIVTRAKYEFSDPRNDKEENVIDISGDAQKQGRIFKMIPPSLFKL